MRRPYNLGMERRGEACLALLLAGRTGLTALRRTGVQLQPEHIDHFHDGGKLRVTIRR